MIFGTDGIRGKAGQFPLDSRTVQKLSRVLKRWLPHGGAVVIGSDTRSSCEELKSFLLADWSDLRIADLGVAPTPAVAFETQARGADLGVMITASHNPPQDNGLKFFDARGLKISSEQAQRWSDQVSAEPQATALRGGAPQTAQADRYRDFIRARFSPADFHGLRLGFDLANGASVHLAKRVLADLEIDAMLTGDAPDGGNINCGVGALHPETIASVAADHGLDAGFAMDGDGDRLAVSTTVPVHGDVVLFALFRLMRAEGVAVDTVVGTILCGLGLEEALRKEGCALERTPVGDQNVLAEMTARGLPLGGEPSGHLIQSDLFPAGDGLLGALRLARGLKQNPDLLRQAHAATPMYPVFEKSYRVAAKPPLEEVAAVQAEVSALRRRLGDAGRLILRYSGTEPKIRVFVEARDLEPCRRDIARLEQVIAEELA